MNKNLDGKIFCLVGATGMGKTTWLKKILSKLYLNTNNLIVIYDLLNQYINFNQNENIFFTNSFDDFKKTIDNFINRIIKNAVIIIDDSVSIFYKIPDAFWRYYLTSNRILNWRTYFVYQSFSDIPPFLLRFVNYFIIFKTFENEQKVKNKITDDRILKAFKIARNFNKNQYIILKIF